MTLFFDISKGQYTARQAMEQGKRVLISKGWKDKAVDLMRGLLKIKWRTHELVRQTLDKSRRKTIVEDTPEDFWERGYTGTGFNMLGRLDGSKGTSYCETTAPRYKDR